MQHLGLLFREPLLHFLTLGALLFALFGALDDVGLAAPDEIVVDRARMDSLAEQFERTWQRPPTPEEQAALVERFVREEILYREGLALGLDRDDPIVRRRIAQKMSVLADASAPTDVTDTELAAWLAAHPGEYRSEARFDLRQVYFDPARRAESLAADLAAARTALETGAEAPRGDATLLPSALDDASASEVASAFGPEFAAALEALPVGGWHGPIRSTYGVHLIELLRREPGRTPALEEVRAAVERDLLRGRADEAGERFHRALRERYRVRVEAP